MRRLVVFAILLNVFLAARSASATTYYIDFFSGTDSNSGISQSAPWKHAPGMNGCAANCASTTPLAGDSLIFKGGVTWDYTIWPWNLPSSGNASTTAVGCNGGTAGGGCIYYGVDPVWFAGSAWTRPVFSGGGWATVNTACNYDQGAAGHNLINASGRQYWIIDNFEFTGMCSVSGTDGGHFGQGSYILMTNGSGTDHFDIENSYFHGWMFPSTFIPSRTASPSPGDYTKAIIGASAGSGNDEKHGEVHDNVFDGSDATNASLPGYATGEGMYGGPGTVFRNVFKDLPESLDPADLITLHDNLFLNGNAVSLSSGSSGAGVHEHLFNSTYDECNATIYNNVAITVAAGEGYDPNVGPGCIEFIFNNIATNVTMAIDGAGVNTFLLSAISTTGTRYVFNNTCEGGPDAAPGPQQGCYREVVGGTVYLSNSHTITTAGSIVAVDAGTLTQATNITQTQSAANAQGYSFSQTFQFSPTAVGDATVGAGTNETSICNMIPNTNAQAACMQDTTYAVGYDSVNHTVMSGPARTPNARPVSGAWDAGAYAFAPSASADVSLALTSNPASVRVGQNLAYMLTVTNASTMVAATSLSLTDTLPSGMTFVSANAAGGTCDNSSGTLTCTLASLAPNADWQPTITVTATIVGSIQDAVTVSARQPDPNPTNNTATVTTTVTASSDVSNASGGKSGGGVIGVLGLFELFAAWLMRRGRDWIPWPGIRRVLTGEVRSQ
ncbi:MAG: DUF11 domain-containing protein [Gammaproteobacteria bacterium]